MGACVLITCPKCHQEFIASPTMLGAGMDFHCPFCNYYFPEQEAEKIQR